MCSNGVGSDSAVTPHVQFRVVDESHPNYTDYGLNVSLTVLNPHCCFLLLKLLEIVRYVIKTIYNPVITEPDELINCL